MKIARLIAGVGLMLVSCLFGQSTVFASSPPALAVPPGLSIAEVKITGQEFVLLENNSGSDIPANELSNYWLYAFNSSDPTASGVSSSSQQLPSAQLKNGETVLLADGGSTCGASVTDNLSVSLNDSAGYLSIVKTGFTGGILTQLTNDALAWTSSTHGATSTSSAITVPTNSTDKISYADYRFLNTSPLAYWWQPASVDSTNSCQLDVIVSGTSQPVSSSSIQLLPSLPPPAKILSLASTSTAGFPTADQGLRAPVITELLPNPAPPATDINGEYIELYNSNSTGFDLSGFILKTGTTLSHKFTFPSGTSLKPNSFTAFLLAGTGLSLSNSAGKAALLDPLGNLISQSDAYGTAKSGQAWALANGQWFWTTTPTPSAENIITQTASGKSSNSQPKVLGASTTISGGSNGAPGSSASVAPLHPVTLAGVGALAVGYGLYEYRTDLANGYRRFRRYREARADAGAVAIWRRGFGATGGLGRWQNNLRARAGSWLGRFRNRN